MIKKLLLILLIGFLDHNNVHSQNSQFDSLITVGVNQIYNIKFAEAEKTFAKLKNNYPKHPAGGFFDAMIVWWKIMLNMEDESYDEELEKKLGEVIDFCDEILDEDEDNIDALFFKGGSLGFRGRLYSIRQKWFDAALDGKDALPLVYRAYEIDPKNIDVQLGFGIYNYYAEAIPEKYPFIKPAMIFFPGGDKKKGLEQLKLAAEKAKYANIEARYFLMTLYYQFEENFNEALVYALDLNKDFPDNPTFQKHCGRIYVKKGDYYSAGNIFSDIVYKCNLNMIGYTEIIKREAVYYVGMKHKLKNEFDDARKSFEECEKLSRKIDLDKDEDSGFLINSVLYLGMIYDQNNERDRAVKNYKEVLTLREHGNSHEMAERYLKQPFSFK